MAPGCLRRKGPVQLLDNWTSLGIVPMLSITYVQSEIYSGGTDTRLTLRVGSPSANVWTSFHLCWWRCIALRAAVVQDDLICLPVCVALTRRSETLGARTRLASNVIISMRARDETSDIMEDWTPRYRRVALGASCDWPSVQITLPGLRKW